MNKHRYTAAAVMLSLSMLTGVAAADYSDLKPHWAEQAMEFAVQSNLMDGISEYTFAADAPATRACLVQALYRMEHAPASDTVLTFQDVAEDASFLTAVRWGVSNGIITGYSDTVFRPGTSLTREQFAVMLHRFAEYKKLDVTAQSALSGFTDILLIRPCANHMQWSPRRTDHRHVRDHAVSAAHGLPRTAGDYFAAFCADDLLPAAGNRCTEAAADPFLHSLHHQTGRRDAQRDRTGPDRSPSSDPPLHGRSGLRG